MINCRHQLRQCIAICQQIASVVNNKPSRFATQPILQVTLETTLLICYPKFYGFPMESYVLPKDMICDDNSVSVSVFFPSLFPSFCVSFPRPPPSHAAHTWVFSLKSLCKSHIEPTYVHVGTLNVYPAESNTCCTSLSVKHRGCVLNCGVISDNPGIILSALIRD